MLLAVFLALGCQADEVGLNGDSGLTNPDDDVICVGDPDNQVVCKKASDFWDCTSMPNGDVKCANNVQQKPGGGGTWTCEAQGSKIVCKSKDTSNPPNGGTDWTCTQEGEYTVCTKEGPVPPGGGSYNCGFDGEFTWVCTGTGTGTPPVGTGDGGVQPPDSSAPAPDSSSTNVPPGGGNIICFDAPSMGGTTTPPEGYWAKIVAQKVMYNGVPAAHIKLWLSKAFVDNTYGVWSIGYSGGAQIGGGHSFQDLVESDKMEIFVDDYKGNLLLHMALDYISQSSSAPSGYDTLGVTGGEGQMLKGNASDVLAVKTSLAVNLNDYGYVLLKDSPKTDLSYTPDPAYPNWIFDVWYEAWVKWSAFGPTGPGRVYVTGLHASPNKTGEKKPSVVPIPCP